MSSPNEQQEVISSEKNEKIVIATPFKRLVAFIIDYSVIMLFLMSLNPLFLPQEWDRLPFKAVIVALVPLYLLGIVSFFCKDILFGTSIGKAFLGLRVSNIDEEFSLPDTKRLIVRNLYLLVFPVELYFLMTNKYCQRLGDRKVGTIVVERKRPPAVRAVTTRVLGLLLILSSVWLLYVIITPIGIKKSVGYNLSMNAIQSDSKVFEKIGRIQSVAYWPEVSYREGQIIYKISVQGEKSKQVIQSVINTTDSTYKINSLIVLDNEEEE